MTNNTITVSMENPAKENPVIKAVILAILLLILLSTLLYFNILPCSKIHPAACDVLYSITAGGKPKVLIVRGNSGIGDPDYLYQVLKGPKFSARVSLKDLSTVSLPVLEENQLVIVEKAKVMSVDEIKMFQKYAVKGGKLVWIADAGTMAPVNESDTNYFLINSQRKPEGNDRFIGPWARRSGDNQVSLDYTLGVNYKGNYCDINPECALNNQSGFIKFIDDEPLVKGLSQALPLYGDFSIVELNASAVQTAHGFLDYQTNLTAKPPEKYFWLSHEKQDFGNEFPVIVTSGVGLRVAYYAFPPEYLVSDNMPIDKKTGERLKYWGLLENLYYGMLYG